MANPATAKYFTKAKNLSATSGGASGDVVYTCPNNHVALITFLHVSNGATSSKKYSIQWYELATTTYHSIVDEVSLAASTNEEVVQGGGYLALAAGDKIIGFEESSSDFHVVVSGAEYYQPT
tara:strand:- start:27 stop:392 length:366 start_codon:yes stop_codon:yes gene_type:complete